MLVTQQKVLRRFWYPIIPADRLTDAPVPFTLLGTKLVLFRDAAGIESRGSKVAEYDGAGSPK